jgi:thiol-disulfide isomerase/thioredoxin
MPFGRHASGSPATTNCVINSRYNSLVPLHTTKRALVSLAALCFVALPGFAQDPAPAKPDATQAPSAPTAKPQDSKKNSGPPLEQQDLQKAIDQAGNDRAALLRNLLDYLKKYPESSQRPQIYRAIVESSLQLRDFPTASEYAERLVALNPEDLSINVLSVQLLERYGDTASWHRATYYCTRVIDILSRQPVSEKSPRVSNEEFEKDRMRNIASILLVRGRLYQKLNDPENAQKDFESSYKLAQSSAAAEKLGELAETHKDLQTAIHQYAIAFALADGSSSSASRSDLRKKLGNAWRVAHGSDDGLGDYLLHTIDETVAASIPPRTPRNQGMKDVGDFVLRLASNGTPYPLSGDKGKVLVMNFWATWCGPCREWEPHFEKVATTYAGQDKDIIFLEVNCDEDETLVGPYIEEEKPKSTVVFADGLDRLLQVNSFPTTVIVDRAGKITYRTEGMDMDVIDKNLIQAINRTLHPTDAQSNPTAAAASH